MKNIPSHVTLPRGVASREALLYGQMSHKKRGWNPFSSKKTKRWWLTSIGGQYLILGVYGRWKKNIVRSNSWMAMCEKYWSYWWWTSPCRDEWICVGYSPVPDWQGSDQFVTIRLWGSQLTTLKYLSGILCSLVFGYIFLSNNLYHEYLNGIDIWCISLTLKVHIYQVYYSHVLYLRPWSWIG